MVKVLDVHNSLLQYPKFRFNLTQSPVLALKRSSMLT